MRRILLVSAVLFAFSAPCLAGDDAIAVWGNGSVWQSPPFPWDPHGGWNTDGSAPLHQIRESSKVAGDSHLKVTGINRSIAIHSMVRLQQAEAGHVVLMGSSDPKVGWQMNPFALTGVFTWNSMFAVRQINREESNASSQVVLKSGGLPSYVSGGSSELVNYLPAIYDRKFDITCYVTEDELDPAFTGGTEITLPGISGKTFNSKFVTETARNSGSGLDRSGNYLQKSGTVWWQPHCPQTSTGRCARDGDTAAVHPDIIPYWATISYRPNNAVVYALDTGGLIRTENDGYRIDLYWGMRKSECKSFGRKFDQEVKLIYRLPI
jgi:hypothetical protein